MFSAQFSFWSDVDFVFHIDVFYTMITCFILLTIYSNVNIRNSLKLSRCGKNFSLRFGTLAIPFTPPCQCLSDETLKAVGPFYLVSMPGEVKDPTSPHWNV